MKDVDPAVVLKRLGLSWTYYDTSEKGWHVFTNVPYIGDAVITKLMRAFAAKEWTAEADNATTMMRVCIR